MRIWIRLATISTAFAVAGVTAADAFATQKLAVRQKASGLTLTLTQKATDEQPSTVNVYAPTGYTWNVVRTNGEVIGTAAGTFFLRDAANKPQRFTGNVVAVVPAAAGHQAQWR